MQEGVHRKYAAPIGLDKPLHYRRKELRGIKRKIGGKGACAPDLRD